MMPGMHARKYSIQPRWIILSVLAGIAAGFVWIQTGNAVTPVSKPTASARKHIMLPTRKDTLPFSDGVLVGDTLYLAGKIGVDPETGRAPEDVEKEIRILLDGMKTTLAAADMKMDDLVSVQIFCPDLSLYEKFNEIYRTYFSKDFPARAFIGSGPLLRGGRFEAQGIAVRR
jgi:2-iminobutanoate/2-iminopropanoate deaminase